MARGWESKSIEEQQAEATQQSELKKPMSKEEIEGRRKRDGLILSRKSVSAQLSSATNSRHREMLEQAIAELDRQIAELQP
jgi:hypothetical protein